MDTCSLHTSESDSPAYSEFSVENLTPMTTLKNSRYDKVADVALSHMAIDPGLFLFSEGPEPMYLPPDWAAFTHPEGQTYFYRSAELRIVTEACMYRPEIMDKISAWANSIEEAFRVKGITLSATIELFLEPREDLESCGYYFVDHATRSEFWIDQVSTDILDLEPVVSISHLKTALEGLYWTHVEYFPMHFNSLSFDGIDKLIGVFSHGQTDRMTSSTSTFPYGVNECEKFIQLLKESRGRNVDGHTTCIVARLWRNIFHSRFIHHYGQEFPRLDRDQSLFGGHTAADHWTFRLGTSLCFGLPDIQFSRFNTIYVDHMVDGNDFCTMISDCMEDWKSSLSSALPLLVANILLSSVPAASKSVGLASILMCCMSAISAIMLSVQHDGLTKAIGGRAYQHLAGIQSDTYGFRPSALVFSAPRALSLWGLGLLMIQVLFLTLRLIHPVIAIALATLVLVVVLGTGQVISAQEPWCCNQLLEGCFTSILGYSNTLLNQKCADPRLNDRYANVCNS